MRLVAVVESVDHVCSRYRLAAFQPFLAVAGHSLELRPLPRSPLARTFFFRELRTADAVILQRKLLPRWQLALLRRYAAKLVFDFDDAIWLRDSYSPKGTACRRRSRRFARTVAAADAVIAGNDFLAAEASRHTPSARVDVIPTSVDPDKYPPAAHTRSGPVQLVWIGSSSTLQGLQRIRPLLEAVGKALPGTRLKLVCDRFLTFDHLPVDPVPWREATEARDIATADVGIAWVPDDDWSRGKCGLKVLQYQAAGLPVIANDVGVHPHLVGANRTGFLANTPEEWIAAVARLSDPAVRANLGGAARRQLDEHYSVAASARKWLAALRRLVEPARQVA
ncbi:glycosyltransferase family 4 protein [Limnoglobus roseus]|uniref:GT4 family glycosyltransferase n=1 Tax=Limnoglobus roseus TaxID=2598579 RepID=A0A5C1A9M9_9BACT|nr:glycosyltransferase family 4 protein [Limnoglobus roseus]QEL14903.1 GT4 family glycosyltransferase [Limnoglobus roseus]